MPRTARQFRGLFLIAILALTHPVSSLAASKNPPSVQTQVKKIGKNRKVDVQLADGTTQVGVLRTFDDSSFSLDEGKNKAVHNFSYTDVTSVKTSPLTTGQKVAVGVGITVIVVAVVFSIAAYSFYHAH